MDLLRAQSLVFEALRQATSQDAGVLKPAEAQLQEWEVERGFYLLLQKIFSNRSVDVNVRWLAAVYFKNGIDKYWRRTAPNHIDENEKIALRQVLISEFQEPVNQVATQLALIISKVARHDCPREWPDLVPTLLNAVESNDPLTEQRALLTLHHVIKALSSKRLPGERRLFQELAANIYAVVVAFWQTYTHSFLAQVTNEEIEANKSLEKALLSLRVLRKLTVYGFMRPHESDDVSGFLKLVFERARQMLECRRTLRSGSGLLEPMEKFIVHLTKVMAGVFEYHPFSFVPFLRTALEFTVCYAFSPQGEQFLFERFLIQCLNLIKGILLCAEYKSGKILEDTKEPSAVLAHQCKMAFFTTETLDAICRKLVSHYFLLTSQDLQLWDSDPESFAVDEGGESWKYSLRPCTESLFLALVHEFRSVLSPVLVDLIRAHHTIVAPDNLAAILAKDAVYSAVGLAAFDMYDEVNIDEWFSTTLRTELSLGAGRGGHYRIVRRRIAWMLGQWTGVKLSAGMRPALYAAMMPLLEPAEDMAVRLTAATTLKCAIDDFDFHESQFLDYLEPACSRLLQLLREVREGESKMRVLYVMAFIVETVGEVVRPHLTGLVQYLPVLWAESAEHNMLRCAIVSTLVHVVKALGPQIAEPQMADFLLRVLQLSTDVAHDSGSHVYLLEDGLDLWLAVLENSARISTPLLQLFHNMPAIHDEVNKAMRTCFSITQAYVLLAPTEFLQLYGEVAVSCHMELLAECDSEGAVMILKLFDVCLRASPHYSSRLLMPLLPHLVKAVYEREAMPMVMTMYLSILSRIILESQVIFVQAVCCASERADLSYDTVLGGVLDTWNAKMALVSQHDKRKLLGIALCNLLTWGTSVILGRFRAILENIWEVLNDITTTDEFGAQVDSLQCRTKHDPSPPQCEYYTRTEHDHRLRRLNAADPVYSLCLQQYLMTQLGVLRNQIGVDAFSCLVQAVDYETLQHVREYGLL